MQDGKGKARSCKALFSDSDFESSTRLSAMVSDCMLKAVEELSKTSQLIVERLDGLAETIVMVLDKVSPGVQDVPSASASIQAATFSPH